MTERLTCVVIPGSLWGGYAHATTSVLSRNYHPKSRVCVAPSLGQGMWGGGLATGHFRAATPDWAGRLIQLESVGGRAHESQCIRIVWSGGDAAYRNGSTDAFSRHAFCERHWQLKVQ
jgi:hypothetical protein